ncbi:MAG: hypothetical protein QXU44_01990 [Candidatus Caldarchaeum sp.]
MLGTQGGSAFLMHPLDSILVCGRPVLTIAYVQQLLDEGVAIKIRKQKVGVIVDSFFGRVFIANDSRYVVKRYTGFAIARRLLKTLARKNVETVVILYGNCGWAAPLSRWLNRGDDVDGMYKHLPMESMAAVPSDLDDTIVVNGGDAANARRQPI